MTTPRGVVAATRPLPYRRPAPLPGAAPGPAKAGSPTTHRRLDVQGLRALAVASVLLYHAHVPALTGGYVGVDVFFVISGFIITSILLRERKSTGRISILHFYGRRVRRIIPPAAVVVVATIWASYHWLGFLRGAGIDDDARWAALFGANLHFALNGTSYLGAQAPPSPLQHFWSLGVEEQFYVVWPALLLVLGVLLTRVTLRARLTVVLVVITGASYAWSIVETGQNGTWAYFSPLTRACELSLGALVAVLAPSLCRVPRPVRATVSWVALAGLIASMFLLDDRTPFPGSAVAWPVVTTALVIAFSADAGALAVLRLRPITWLGDVSYSLYLWHWPLLIVFAEKAAAPLPMHERLLLLLTALVFAAVSYYVIERPINHARLLVARPLVSLLLGAALIGAMVGVAQYEKSAHPQFHPVSNNPY